MVSCWRRNFLLGNSGRIRPRHMSEATIPQVRGGFQTKPLEGSQLRVHNSLVKIVEGYFVGGHTLGVLSTGGTLVARIARPTSLAIWHRGRSHRKPNRSGSPNRRHFASLDLRKHADISHRRPTSQDFRQKAFLAFSCDFRSS